jgi:hypothetical protein
MTGICPPSSFRLITYGRHVMAAILPMSAGGTASVTSNVQLSACRISFALHVRQQQIGEGARGTHS